MLGGSTSCKMHGLSPLIADAKGNGGRYRFLTTLNQPRFFQLICNACRVVRDEPNAQLNSDG